MKRKIRTTLLCMAALSVLTLNGNAMAGNTETESSGESVSFWSDSSKRTETEETVSAGYTEITENLTLAGSADGYDIYRRDKGFDDIIWEKAGGKPAKRADYTPEQEETAEMIDRLKKLGELTAVEPEAQRVSATFNDSRSSGEERIHISGGGRFLLYTDKESGSPVKLREVVSTVDNDRLFRSADGNILELMSGDLSRVMISYRKSRPSDISDRGKLVFRSEDGKSFAWLSEDGAQVIGTFRECAENGSYILLVDDRLGNIGLKSREDGYIWWSSPLGGTRDEKATPLIADELMSSTVLRYGVPARQNHNNYLRSGSQDCEISVSDITNGVRVSYRFSNAGFSYPVEYTLEEDHLKASLKVSEIEETVYGNTATEITLMGAFGAAPEGEEGYFVIPDGSGALMRFGSNKAGTDPYSGYVYGSDITAVPTRKGAVTEQIYLPAYGIVREGKALLAVAAKGDTNAYLTARTPEQSNSGYEQCGFTFVLRGTDTFYLSGKSGDKLTVFESGNIMSDDIEMLYFPVSGEAPDYTDIAARYRQYLLDSGVTAKADSGKTFMYVDLYGGVRRKKPFLGVPVTMKQPVTGFSDAVDILEQLENSGVEDIVLTYNDWTDDGISDKIDTSAKPSGKLGGKSGFRELTSYIGERENILLYPAADNTDYYPGGGYNKYSGSAVRISGAYARLVSYDPAYGIPDGTRKNRSLLSPEKLPEVWSKTARSYSGAGIEGVSVNEAAALLYGDYGKNHITRAGAARLAAEGFSELDGALENGVIADGANAYALPFVSRITGLPLTSGRFDVFDEDIPFLQMVLHGVIPYSTKAVNGSADPDALLLMAAVTGSSLSYDLIAGETGILKDTDYDIYYYAGAGRNTARAAAEYKLLKPLLSDVSDSTITGYEISGDVIISEFSNGTVVRADMEKKTIEFNGETIDLNRLRESESNG